MCEKIDTSNIHVIISSARNSHYYRTLSSIAKNLGLPLITWDFALRKYTSFGSILGVLLFVTHLPYLVYEKEGESV